MDIDISHLVTIRRRDVKLHVAMRDVLLLVVKAKPWILHHLLAHTGECAIIADDQVHSSLYLLTITES